MDSFSSTLNEDKNINRSDSSRMYNIIQTPLARLRPEKLDDIAIKKQISLIQEICGDIDPDLIAIVFHECDYNIQNTITRIKTGNFEDGGWQTAKSNNKKKNHNNLNDQILNGSTQSDSERSLSQRTSPTPSLRGGAGRRRRQDHYQYSSSIRTNTRRRGNDSNRNHFVPSNPRYLSRNNPNNNNNKSIQIQQNPNEINSSLKKKEEITPTPTSSSIDEYEFIGGTTQSLTFDNSLKKMTLSSSTKRPIPSSIPQEPVSMHPIIPFSTEPIDIQFGDVQWNDSIPIAITPSNSPILIKSLDEQQSLPITTTIDHEQQADVQDNLSSNYQTTNQIDRELLETTNRLSSSSLSIINNTISNNSAIIPLEGTSHLSDHLTNSLQQQIPSSSSSLTDTTRLPPTSTPNTSEYTSPISQNNNPFISNNLQLSLSNTNNVSTGNSSAFIPYNTPGNFHYNRLISRDYPQSTSTWNQQSSNYKTNSKSTMIQTGNYPQQTSYQLPPQQQFFLGTYPYHTPTLYPVITSVDPWSTAGFEPYSTYPTTNYIQTYPTQQQYHPATIQSNKNDQYLNDKDYFAHYGQTRLSNNELSNSSQTIKDAPITSKLSANAASFSQASTSPATAYYINPVLYTVPTYYTSHQDRTMSYPSVDNRDNRNGASYGGNNNRNHYHQQQRTHNNSAGYSQQ